MFVEQSVSLSVRPSVSPPLQPPSSMSGRPSKLVLGQFCSGEITRRSAWPLLYTGVMVYIIATGVTLYYYGKNLTSVRLYYGDFKQQTDYIMGQTHYCQTLLLSTNATVTLYGAAIYQLSWSEIQTMLWCNHTHVRLCYCQVTQLSGYETTQLSHYNTVQPQNCHALILSSQT